MKEKVYNIEILGESLSGSITGYKNSNEIFDSSTKNGQTYGKGSLVC